MFALDGRVAVVTGGSSGIGLGIARGLAACGAHVEIWARDPGRNREALAELRATGGHEASASEVDVTVEDAVDRAMDSAVDRYGRVDVVVTSAGLAEVAASHAELQTAQWRQVLAVNLDGTMFTFRAALRHMGARSGGGSLIAIGSRLATAGQPRAPHYSASKAALAGLVRSIAREYGPAGIRANLVHPGWIDTPMSALVIAKAHVAQARLPRIPLGRWGRPEDIVGIVAYLAGDASSYHTGDTITVDGGDGLG